MVADSLEHLVCATLKQDRDHHRGGGASAVVGRLGLAVAVPASLRKTTNIEQILQAADDSIHVTCGTTEAERRLSAEHNLTNSAAVVVKEIDPQHRYCRNLHFYYNVWCWSQEGALLLQANLLVQKEWQSYSCRASIADHSLCCYFRLVCSNCCNRIRMPKWMHRRQ